MYQVGDKLRIRQWDDMKAEFGVDERNTILCGGSFVREMRPLCGQDFTVSSAEKAQSYSGMKYRSVEQIEGTDILTCGYWTISDDMLEPREEDAPIFVADDAALADLLF
jgi:hypothetical protein